MQKTLKKFCLPILAWLMFGMPTLAHWSDLSAAEINIQKQNVKMLLTFPTRLVSNFDDDHNNQISETELVQHRNALTTFLNKHIQFLSDNTVGNLSLNAAKAGPRFGPNTNAQTSLWFNYTWSKPLHQLKIRYDLFVPGVSTASCIATVLYDGKAQEFVFRPNNREFFTTTQANKNPQGFLSFVSLGIGHILSGYDHLLFVLSLLMLGGGLSYLLKVVSAFTLAHSITLSLAALGIVNLPSRFVESSIALTIAYVAAENLFRKDVGAVSHTRWIFTFVFGLVHGLGFASVLAEIGLPHQNLAASLLGFNLGVELGQLSVVIPTFMLLQLLRRMPWELRLRQTISLAAVGAGLFWFVERAFLI